MYAALLQDFMASNAKAALCLTDTADGYYAQRHDDGDIHCLGSLL